MPRRSLPASAALLLAALLPALPGAGDDRPPFRDATAESGLDFFYVTGATGAFHFPEIAGGGGALLDYDGDGDLDLFLVQGGYLGDGTPDQAVVPAPPGTPAGDRLYRNDLATGADGRPRPAFIDVTAASGLDGETGYGMGATAADYDGDGHVDLYVTNFGSNRLWKNRGDGTFADVTAESGADDPRWSVPAAFFDADGDGDLDLYVGNYVAYVPARNKPCLGNTGVRDYCGPQSYPPEPDRLLLQGDDGAFTNADAALGGAGEGTAGAALGVAVSDFDGDGRSDLYVANDGSANHLWMARGDGTFRDEALLRGCALNAEGKAEASMGADAADYDGDGDDDLFLTHLDRETNTLYVNDGDGNFHDASVASGLGMASWKMTGFGTAWLDYDNDGRLDVLVANGAVFAIEALRRDGHPYPYHQPNQLFRNLGPGGDGEWRFREVTGEAGPPFTASHTSRGALVGDLDDDGDEDVVIVNANGRAQVLLNQVGQDRHWIGLRPVLPSARGAPPRDALGARVEVRAAAGPGGERRTQVRRVRVDGSYAVAHDPRVLVGLGAAAGPADVVVTWPDGRREAFPGLEPDRYHTLLAGSGEAPAGAAATNDDDDRPRTPTEGEEDAP